jgi:hypothetical protein
MRGHYTICTKSYAKPKNIWNQKGFTNDRLRMNLKADGFWPDFAFKSSFKIASKGNHVVKLAAFASRSRRVALTVRFRTNRVVTPSSGRFGAKAVWWSQSHQPVPSLSVGVELSHHGGNACLRCQSPNYRRASGRTSQAEQAPFLPPGPSLSSRRLFKHVNLLVTIFVQN